MSKKAINCRTHGGVFTIEARRGRPPVRCTEDNPCTKADNRADDTPRRTVEIQGHKIEVPKRVKAAVSAAAKEVKAKPAKPVETQYRMQLMSAEELEQISLVNLQKFCALVGYTKLAELTSKKALIRGILKAREARDGKPTELPAALTRKSTRKPAEPAPEAAEVVTRVNASVPLAHAAKAQLEALGWKCSARAYFDTLNERKDAGIVAFEASRGTERISILWADGELISQQYSLWNVDKPSDNGKPASQLKFDPDELSDGELVRHLSGMTVTWWNKLGQMEEKAVIPSKLSITHSYDGKGDETPADRVVNFIDMSGHGFRSFRVGQLIKVG